MITSFKNIKSIHMKKVLFSVMLLGCIGITGVKAQEEKEKTELKEKKEKLEKKELKEKKERQEIVISSKGNIDTKVVVEIKGDKVTINGKPISEFKDDNVTINKRNISVWGSDMNFNFDFPRQNFNWNSDGKGEPHAFLGVSTDENEAGAVITNVTKESPAEKAGLKNGDIITKINDKKVEDPESLSDVVTSFKPKEEVTVYYKRDGKESSSKAVLGERKSMSYSYSLGSSEDGVHSFSMPKIDVHPRINTDSWKQLQELESIPKVYNYNFDNENAFGGFFPRTQKLGIKIQDTEDGKGIKVLDVEKDSPAEKAGLKKDDVITEIGDKKVNNTDEAREQLMENAEKSAYTIKGSRNGSNMSFDIKIPKKLKTANL